MHPWISHLYWESPIAFSRSAICISSLERYQFLRKTPTHRLVTAEILNNCCLIFEIPLPHHQNAFTTLRFTFGFSDSIVCSKGKLVQMLDKQKQEQEPKKFPFKLYDPQPRHSSVRYHSFICIYAWVAGSGYLSPSSL